MIVTLKGKLAYKADFVIVEINGIGYEVFMSAQGLMGLPSLGEEVSLRIYTHVREDALQLFGFISQQEHYLFKAIIGITGFGPKLALQILSQITPKEFSRAISTSDSKRLCEIKGLGKKKVEYLILGLKNRIVSGIAYEDFTNSVYSELRSALDNLGFDSKEIEFALTEINNKLPDDKFALTLDKLLPVALQLITKGK